MVCVHKQTTFGETLSFEPNLWHSSGIPDRSPFAEIITYPFLLNEQHWNRNMMTQLHKSLSRKGNQNLNSMYLHRSSLAQAVPDLSQHETACSVAELCGFTGTTLVLNKPLVELNCGAVVYISLLHISLIHVVWTPSCPIPEKCTGLWLSCSQSQMFQNCHSLVKGKVMQQKGSWIKMDKSFLVLFLIDMILFTVAVMLKIDKRI